jgi:Ca2+/Na+ antiporter
MITSENIQQYINFLHEKRYRKPATEDLLARWQNLSDFEIIKELQGLYSFWGIDANTAAIYERMFQQSQQPAPAIIENTTTDTVIAPTLEEAPKEKKSGTFKYFVFLIIVLLTGAATIWFYRSANKLSETNNELEKKVQQVNDSINKERAVQLQRENELQRQAKEKEDKIKEVSSNIGKYLTSKATYDFNSTFGGIDNVQITVSNNSDFKINEVTISLMYIKKNGDLYDTKSVTLSNIPAHQQKTVQGPDSKRGMSMSTKITAFQSDELEGK